MTRMTDTYLNNDVNKAFIAIVATLWTGVASANIDGSDTQLFNAALSAKDYVTTKSSSTIGSGNYSIGLFINHANNTLPYFDHKNNSDKTDRSKTVNDSIISGEILATFGLTDFWDFGVGIPYIIAQQVESEDYHGEFIKPGNTGVRATTKLNLYKGENLGISWAASLFQDRTKNNPYTGSPQSPAYTLELIPEWRSRIFSITTNLGYKWRKPGDSIKDMDGNTPIQPTLNQTLASMGVRIHLNKSWDIITEAYGSQSENEFSKLSERKNLNSEALFGLQHHINKHITAHAGISSEIEHSVSSSDMRFYAGLHWSSQRENLRRTIKQNTNKKARTPDQVLVLSDVLFKFNSAEIAYKRAKDELAKVAKIVHGPRGLEKIIVEGHTCSIGSDTYNLGLSRRRALSVKNFLVKEFKIPAQKIISYGFGELKPIASNKYPKGRKVNRRVEFKIYHKHKLSPSSTK